MGTGTDRLRGLPSQAGAGGPGGRAIDGHSAAAACGKRGAELPIGREAGNTLPAENSIYEE